MVKTLVLISGLGAMLVVGLAIAQTPFGGDDSGVIPASKTTLNCERKVGKSLGKAAACILGCHKKRASGVFTDETGEDNCENNLPAAADCEGKYNAVTGTLNNCPSCLSAANRAALFGTIEGLIDNNNDKIYCTGSTAWGGDDTGVIPPDKTTAKCENTVGKAAAKAIACIIKCHFARAKGKLTDDTAEDGCESGPSPSSCNSKYTNAAAKGCPCDPNLFDFIESQVDGVNGSVYCSASPSGAFLD
jgi:hypothetical protein